jgi:hypothetical protein
MIRQQGRKALTPGSPGSVGSNPAAGTRLRAIEIVDGVQHAGARGDALSEAAGGHAVTVPLEQLRAAVTVLGYFSGEWTAIVRGRTVEQAKLELTRFLHRADGRAFLARRLAGDAAVKLALAALAGHQVCTTKQKHGAPLPYLYPTTESAWRLTALFDRPIVKP